MPKLEKHNFWDGWLYVNLKTCNQVIIDHYIQMCYLLCNAILNVIKNDIGLNPDMFEVTGLVRPILDRGQVIELGRRCSEVITLCAS